MIKRILKYTLLVSGCLFFILVLICFTSGPFWAWYKLGTRHAGIHRPPEYIVVLGGGGMPSESGLMRTWYAARIGNHFSKAKMIIALPGDTADSLSSVSGMKEELILRGISASRILLESSGTNTRGQAMNIIKIVNRASSMVSASSTTNRSLSLTKGASSILIVTSPEHLYRAVRAFRKAGFLKVDGVPAFETAIESELSFNDAMLGGKKWVPSIGNSITVRYKFWTQLHYEQLVIREWLAILYYKVNGWI